MDRKEKILTLITREKEGLEIGPLHRGLAPKRDGFNTFIMDHGSRETLLEKYGKSERVNPNLIEEVDYVWNGEPYDQLIEKKFDYIIASHVIEHTPDLIGFLNSCASILKEDGVVSLVVPDMRYCFDFFRYPTDLSNLIDAHNEKRTRHSEGTLVTTALNSSRNGPTHIWKLQETNNYKLAHNYESVDRQLSRFKSKEGYADMHAWCFTYSSFRLHIMDLNNLDYIPFTIAAHFPTAGCEFYITLKKGKERINLQQRRVMKLQVQKELMKAWAK